jgi:1-acyl-sn-glycerol-3-phosphate acyltransferase
VRPSSFALVGLVKLLVGAYPRWVGCAPEPTQRIYFANHTSHIDTMAIWSALPIRMRGHTRAVLIDRSRSDPNANPLAPLIEALQRGESLILFPEGTRGRDAMPAAFKSGLYHLAEQFPDVPLIPVYLENLHRSLPKGAFLPIPMTCTVRFGAPMSLGAGEAKDAFLERARGEVIRLAGSRA